MQHYRIAIVFGALTIFPFGASFAADDNIAVIDQSGDDNTGLITQLGSNNRVGYEGDPIFQDGYYNELTIEQTGENNRIGLEGTGVNQAGDSSVPSVFNTLFVNQNSDGNTVGSIYQAALGSIPDGANRLVVRQGLDGNGDQNRITTIVQEQLDGMPGQVANLIQTGDNNTINLVEQRSLTAAEFQENRIDASFSGSFNGRGDFTGPALTSRAIANSLVQRIGYDGLGANGNEMDLSVKGDFNRFGIFQGGRKNSVGFVTISGNSNQVGFRQDGLENDITSSEIGGDGNRIGIGQIGTNRAFLSIIGFSSDNDLLGLQEGTNDLRYYVDGNGNDLSAEQGYSGGLGGDNFADISVSGNLNFFDVKQFGKNRATISVSGNLNNDPSLSFSGDSQIGLAPGFIDQIGMDNLTTATISGDQNMVGVSQTGNINAVTVTMLGNFNQAAFIQAGSLNTAWLYQSGNGNSAGFKQ